MYVLMCVYVYVCNGKGSNEKLAAKNSTACVDTSTQADIPCMFVCIYMPVRMNVFMYVYIIVCIYVCMHVCMHI